MSFFQDQLLVLPSWLLNELFPQWFGHQPLFFWGENCLRSRRTFIYGPNVWKAAGDLHNKSQKRILKMLTNAKETPQKTPKHISSSPKNNQTTKNQLTKTKPTNQKKPTQTPPSPQISESFLSCHVLVQEFLACGILTGTCSNGNSGFESVVVGTQSFLEQLNDLEDLACLGCLSACYLIADSTKISFPQSEDWFSNCQHWFFCFFYVAQLNRSWQNTVQTTPCFLHLGEEAMHSHLSKLEKNGAFSFSLPSWKIVLKSLSSQGAFSFWLFLPVLLCGLPQHLLSFSTGELSLALIKRQLKGRLMQGKAAWLIWKESREGICQRSPGCDVSGSSFFSQ